MTMPGIQAQKHRAVIPRLSRGMTALFFLRRKLRRFLKRKKYNINLSLTVLGKRNRRTGEF
jgi:hypothetical protein